MSAAPTPSQRTAYLVLGMHRSGTSAVTQLLALAGASLPANLMPGDEHNAKGYFEPWKIAMFNEVRLHAAGSSWDDPFAFPFRPLDPPEERKWFARARDLFHDDFGAAPWPLMKDPRATVLLPLWREVLADEGVGARCVIPVRHPLAVAGSLRRRDNFPAQKSVLIWSAYMLAAEAYTRDLPRAFVGYDALLSDWRSEVARLEAAHGAPLPDLTEQAARQIDLFLTPELRHNTAEPSMADLGWAGEIATQVHDWFAARAAGGEPDPAALADAAATLDRWRERIGPLVSPQARDLGATRVELHDVTQQINAVKAERDAYFQERTRLERELQQALRALSDVGAQLDAPIRGE